MGTGIEAPSSSATRPLMVRGPHPRDRATDARIIRAEANVTRYCPGHFNPTRRPCWRPGGGQCPLSRGLVNKTLLEYSLPIKSGCVCPVLKRLSPNRSHAADRHESEGRARLKTG